MANAKSFFLFFLILISYIFEINAEKARLARSRVESLVVRLHPNQDIMQGITQLLNKHSYKAVTISSATGSVQYCYIRFANKPYLSRVSGPLQITSLTGTFDNKLNPHVHITVANGEGNAFGGHLPSLKERQFKLNTSQIYNLGIQDCPIFTTLQLVMLVHQDLIFQRKIDPETTYDQLTIRTRWQRSWGNFNQADQMEEAYQYQ